MVRAGITGGIGSGKTTVCRFFGKLGVPVYHADLRARELMTADTGLADAIRKRFGEDIYLPDGQVDRTRLANRVFNQPDELRALNNLVHPAVWQDMANWMAAHAEKPYTLYEAAILFETGSYKMFDKVIVVTAPEPLRISRVMERDGVDEGAVRARMANQLPESEKAEKADYVIVNDGRRSLLGQVLQIHKELIESSYG